MHNGAGGGALHDATLPELRPVGACALDNVALASQTAQLSISIGEVDARGRGDGT